MGLFSSLWIAKSSALLMLLVSLLGSKGKKDEKIRPRTVAIFFLAGLAFYFASNLLIMTPGLYICGTILYYFFILTGGGLLFRMLDLKINTDIFNLENETFP